MNFPQTRLMPKYSVKIAWHEPVDSAFFSATSRTVIWQFPWITSFTWAIKVSFLEDEGRRDFWSSSVEVLPLWKVCTFHSLLFYSEYHRRKLDTTFCGFPQFFSPNLKENFTQIRRSFTDAIWKRDETGNTQSRKRLKQYRTSLELLDTDCYM
jgi:hypothetical protein